MKALVICAAFFVGQMNPLQEKQIVHLQPHSNLIRGDSGGKLLELRNAPTIICLPLSPPRVDYEGHPWSLDIRNLGPRDVTIVGTSQFTLQIIVGKTVTILGNGISYTVKRSPYGSTD